MVPDIYSPRDVNTLLNVTPLQYAITLHYITVCEFRCDDEYSTNFDAKKF